MITKLSHVGIVVNNLEQAQETWVSKFGLTVARSGYIEEEGIRNSFLSIGSNFIELMQPVNPGDSNNAIARRLMERGEGVFHIAVISDDVVKESIRLDKLGFKLIKRPPSEDQPFGRYVVHPKSANGVLVEILSK